MRQLVLVLLTMVFLPPLAGVLAQPSSSESLDKVELTTVKLAGLEKVLKSHQGKIVIMYMWGDYSPPDKVMMFDVVKMQQRFGKAPIVFMTVCHSPVDREDRKKYEKKQTYNLEFLKKSKARFQNFVLDEDDEVWIEKLGFSSGPTFGVHDKSGKKVKTFSYGDEDYRLNDVEDLLKKLDRGKLSPK